MMRLGVYRMHADLVLPEEQVGGVVRVEVSTEVSVDRGVQAAHEPVEGALLEAVPAAVLLREAVLLVWIPDTSLWLARRLPQEG